MKKIFLSAIALLIITACTSGETKRTIDDTKERVKNTEQYLWEKQVVE